jgi:hypothetical protein
MEESFWFKSMFPGALLSENLSPVYARMLAIGFLLQMNKREEKDSAKFHLFF